MMRMIAAVVASISISTLAAPAARAQHGGNAAYGGAGGRAQAIQAERARRAMTREEMPPDTTSMFVDASVLINAKADAYVATFGIAEEAQTVEACQAKMAATVADFAREVGALGVDPASIHVDFTAQTKVYDYKIEGNLAREYLAGFEIKKTASVPFRDKDLVDRLVVAASRARVFDLIKVDYVVTDPAPIRARLAEEAAAVVKAKLARRETLLGIQVRPMPQVYADRESVFSPSDLYDSYAAAEGGGVSPREAGQSQVTVQSLRKGHTFYFHPLGPDGFDRVVDPVVVEPVVQFTLYLKLKYELARQ